MGKDKGGFQMEIKAFIEKNKENIIKDIAELVSFDSVSNHVVGNEHPYGDVVAKTLDATLAMFEREGFATKNVDYHAGYGEIGHGTKLIGILAHIDIVPAGKGWTSDPFTLTRRDGKLYGRGSTDDKGPAICTLYAMKYLKESGVDISKRVRLIVGCNEEKGASCLAHYVEKEGQIDYGFTPDGNFPGIHGEKGQISATFVGKTNKIIAIEGGLVSNAVCNEVMIELPLASYDEAKLEQYFGDHKIKFEVEKADTIKLTVFGVAAHASEPQLGINAIGHLFAALAAADFKDDFVVYYNEHVGLMTDGSSFGNKLEDEYGPLTFNNGVISMKDGHIEGTIDIRVPVTLNPADVEKDLVKKLNDDNGSITTSNHTNPLFFDPKDPMVQALVSAYREVTNDPTEPMVIGGGTYSKGINNCIAFGCEYPGKDYHIHDVDEFAIEEEIYEQVEIYIKAIQNLLAL